MILDDLLAEDGEFQRYLLPARSHLIVVALGHEDHCRKVEGEGRNDRSKQWEWKWVERPASELWQSEIKRHPACDRDSC